MSANASESDWVTFESQTILFSDPTNSRRRLIPLRLDDTEPSDTLKQFAHIDWRQQSPDQYDALLSSCRPQAATQAPQPMQAAASMARSAVSLPIRWTLPSTALPVETEM